MIRLCSAVKAAAYPLQVECVSKENLVPRICFQKITPVIFPLYPIALSYNFAPNFIWMFGEYIHRGYLNHSYDVGFYNFEGVCAKLKALTITFKKICCKHIVKIFT